jgi:hypothetical protein
MEATIDERRGKPRKQVVGVRLQSPTLTGRILDLSGGGIGIETPQCVTAGDLHEVTISYSGKTVVAEGAVKWIDRAYEALIGQVAVPVFRAGIELTRPAR